MDDDEFIEIIEPPIVDLAGNLSVHGQEGLYLAVGGEEDEDMGAKALLGMLLFRTATPLGGADHDIALDRFQDSEELDAVLILTPAQVAAIPADGTEFVLLDVGGPQPVGRWSGVLTRRGW